MFIIIITVVVVVIIIIIIIIFVAGLPNKPLSLLRAGILPFREGGILGGDQLTQIHRVREAFSV